MDITNMRYHSILYIGRKSFIIPKYWDKELGQRIGVRQSYLDIFITSKNQFRTRLGYITPSQEHRFIWGGFINTESDLFDEELWAKTTTLIINEDRINGTFSYQKYERNH